MKILSFTFQPINGEYDPEVLAVAEKMLKQKGLDCGRVGNNIVASFRHEDWDKPVSEIGSRSFPENSFWGIEVPGMEFSNITAIYGEAVVPDNEHKGNFFNGKSYWGKELRVVVECDIARKRVSLSMDVPKFDSSDQSGEYGLEFMGVQHKFENMIKLTRIFLKLQAACNSDSRETDRMELVKQYTDEFLVLIGGI